MKVLLRVAGGFILLLAAVIGYGAYANNAAEAAAKAFCDRTEMGSDVSLAIARAGRESVRYRGARTHEGREEHDFAFQGWVFNAGVCRVGVANGKVISLAAAMEGD